MADDEFSDLDVGQFGLGVLAGFGGDEHSKAASKVTPAGMQFDMTCDICGQPQRVTISWDELIFVSCGRVAPGTPTSRPWAYDPRRGALHPNTPCVRCQRLDTLLCLTPDEASRHLKAGVQAGSVQQAYINAAVAQLGGRPGR